MNLKTPNIMKNETMVLENSFLRYSVKTIMGIIADHSVDFIYGLSKEELNEIVSGICKEYLPEVLKDFNTNQKASLVISEDLLKRISSQLVRSLDKEPNELARILAAAPMSARTYSGK